MRATRPPFRAQDYCWRQRAKASKQANLRNLFPSNCAGHSTRLAKWSEKWIRRICLVKSSASFASASSHTAERPGRKSERTEFNHGDQVAPSSSRTGRRNRGCPLTPEKIGGDAATSRGLPLLL